jgi:hypothetical protein
LQHFSIHAEFVSARSARRQTAARPFTYGGSCRTERTEQMTNLPSKPKTAIELILEAASRGPTPLLKFKKEKYEVGDKEIPLGTRFLAYCKDWRKGWIKFVGDEKVDERIGRVADGFNPCERDELGDTDREEWDRDDDGKARDPWVFQQYLPLENVETGERFLFVTSSTGGGIGVELLCQRWARDIQKGAHCGLPVVKLGTGTFHTKKFGSIKRPDFPVMSWPDDATAPSFVAIDDDWPTQEGDPQDLYDPDDPQLSVSR